MGGLALACGGASALNHVLDRDIDVHMRRTDKRPVATGRVSPERALEFTTGYLIEEALSVDNMFVFLIIFTYFKVPAALQHRVLFWGIVGALVMRAIFILAGAALIAKFHWIIYLFGAFLILTGIKMITEQNKEIHPEKNPVLRLFRRLMPVTESYEGDHFFVLRGARRYATPLFIVLLMVETTDVIRCLSGTHAKPISLRTGMGIAVSIAA